MSKRENIIVALMLLVVAYGAYEFLFAGKIKTAPIKSQAGLEQLNAFISKVATSTQTGLSKTESYIIDRAQAEWMQDPMLYIAEKAQPMRPSEELIETPDMEYDVSYTGYLEMGSIRLAIINGMEYETGDRLEPGGYVIERIYPNKVELTSATGSQTNLVLPLKEID